MDRAIYDNHGLGLGGGAKRERGGVERSIIERAAVVVLVSGFAIGTVTHTLQLVSTGWIVFDDAPTWMNVYWTALTLLDPLAALLLLLKQRLGLVLGVAIMLSDVGINSYAMYGLHLPFSFTALQLQTLGCGFLLGAAGFLKARATTTTRLTQKVGADGGWA